MNSFGIWKSAGNRMLTQANRMRFVLEEREAAGALPVGLAEGVRLQADVPAGTRLTVEIVAERPDSVGWGCGVNEEDGNISAHPAASSSACAGSVFVAQEALHAVLRNLPPSRVFMYLKGGKGP